MEEVRLVRAEDGDRGGQNCRQGASGADRVLAVPVGTTVYDSGEGGAKRADLTRAGERWLAARGGAGGRGNAAFATATRQRPDEAERGEPGEERRLRLELRLLADVGLVGLPNAGKSTLLARVTRARPRVAPFPFTTLAPHLGIAEAGGFRFVLADLPGLIAGAHAGRGLGDRFLRHVERTRVLVHLLEIEPLDGSDPAANYRAVRQELLAYGRDLAARPEIVVVSKVDLLPADRRAEALRRVAQAVDRDVHPLSAVTGEGVAEWLAAVARVLGEAPPPPPVPGRLDRPRRRPAGSEDPPSA
jgi:GTP-binding protein